MDYFVANAVSILIGKMVVVSVPIQKDVVPIVNIKMKMRIGGELKIGIEL